MEDSKHLSIQTVIRLVKFTFPAPVSDVASLEMVSHQEIATRFGRSLDKDEFEFTQKLLSRNCQYVIGKEVLIGPEDICRSYEQNMIAGRKKLDELEWGVSSIEPINDSEFYVHFTDYLTHKGEKYTHRCKQKVRVNEHGLISRIEHVHDQGEQDRLDKYYQEVGLK